MLEHFARANILFIITQRHRHGTTATCSQAFDSQV